MARRRQNSLIDDTFDVLMLAPAWVGPVLAVLAFLVLRYVAPMFFTQTREGFDSGQVIRQVLPMLAWLVAAAIMLLWFAAEIHKLFNRRRLDRQTGIESIRDLSWQDFERLVCEAYRRRGYLAQVVGSAAGDGGVDIELTRPGEMVLVQCKQWRAYTVGVRTARELLGVVVSRRAARGILVTSGRFTREAVRFAEQNSQIELVGGTQLAELIASVRVGRETATSPSPTTPSPALPLADRPMCPKCVRRWFCERHDRERKRDRSFGGARSTRRAEGRGRGTPLLQPSRSNRREASAQRTTSVVCVSNTSGIRASLARGDLRPKSYIGTASSVAAEHTACSLLC